jgi:HSP20 family molecular chaperone IbpA
VLLRADCFEEEGDLVVEVEVPGSGAESLDVRVGCGVLRVAARSAAPDAGRRYHRRERGAGVQMREIALPVPVLTRLARVTLEEGLLTVRLPLDREQTGQSLHAPFPD